MRAGVRCQDLQGYRLDRRQDGHADISNDDRSLAELGRLCGLLGLGFGTASAAQSPELGERPVIVRNVGVPVLPAIQSISLQVLASNTCSHASRDVPAR